MRRLALIAVSLAVVAGACGSSTATTAPASKAAPVASAAASSAPTPTGQPTDSTGRSPSPKPNLPAGWTLFTPDSGSFSIAFPGTPTASTNTQTTQLGDVEVNAYSVVVGATTYLATQERFPGGTISGFSGSDLDTFMGGILTGLVTSNSGVASNQADITFASYPAKTVTITAGTDAEDVLIFKFANDTYILAVKHLAASKVDTAMFFGSFQLP